MLADHVQMDPGLLNSYTRHIENGGSLTYHFQTYSKAAISKLPLLSKAIVDKTVNEMEQEGYQFQKVSAGTAQKLILNMISTSVMIKLDRVKGNKMVDMQLSNNKLVKRGTNMVMKELKVDEEKAKKILLKHKSVRAAIKNNG